MRVISGTARSIRLKTVDGMDVRPTTDRIKETLFNMIAPDIYGSSFLDLFSGSGGIGIEALSRGADRAVFVDKDRRSIECIKQNLERTHLQDRAGIMQSECTGALQRLAGSGTCFDIIFMDPPYDRLLERDVLRTLSALPVAGRETLIIVEASLETSFDYLDALGYSLIRAKKYKTNQHVFVRKK